METCGSDSPEIVPGGTTITDLPSGWLQALVKHPHIGASELLNLFLAGVKPAHVVYQHASCSVTLVAIHGQSAAHSEVQQQRQWQQLAGLVEKLDASQCKLSLSIRGTLHCALPDGLVNAMCKLTCHNMAMGIASCERLRVFDTNKLVTLRFEDPVLCPDSKLHVVSPGLQPAHQSSARCGTSLFKLELAGFPRDAHMRQAYQLYDEVPAPPSLVKFIFDLYGSRAHHIDLHIQGVFEIDFTQLVYNANCPNLQSLNFHGFFSTADIAAVLESTPVDHIEGMLQRCPDVTCNRALQKFTLAEANSRNLGKLLSCVTLHELCISGTFGSLDDDDFDWDVEEHVYAEQQLLQQLQAVNNVTFMHSSVGLYGRCSIINVRSAELIDFLLQHSPATLSAVYLKGCSNLVTQHEHLNFPDHVWTVMFHDDPHVRFCNVMWSECAFSSPAGNQQIRESFIARIVEIQSWATGHCPGVKHLQLSTSLFSSYFLKSVLKDLKGRLLEVPGVTLSLVNLHVEATEEQRTAFELLAAT